MRWLSLALLATFAYPFESTFEVENTNIFTKTKDAKYSDYNRLRVYGIFEDINYENFSVLIIVDNENTYTRADKHNYNETNIYRGYLKYSDDIHFAVLGKQRVPYGVGQVWNPIDIYNPIDSTSIETSERQGVEALHYEYALNEVSNIDTTLSKDKGAVRVKGYVDIADMAVLVLKDNENKQNIFGYEIQGELANSGVELRSEGGYFKNENSTNYREAIFGGEYGFENSLNILLEYKYNTLQNQDYLALNLTYTFSPLLNGSALHIKNLDDRSSITLVKLDYSLSDDMELNFGGYFYDGKSFSEYGALSDSYFVRYFIHF